MENGTSLAECLVALVILSIAAAAATPAVDSWVTQSRLNTATQQLRQDLAYARHLAVMRQQPIGIQPLTINCWGCGWRVTTNPATPDMRVLTQRAAAAEPLRILSSSTWRAGATFMPDGAAVQNGGAFAAGSFSVCAADSDYYFKVIVSKSGRARITRETARCL
ncbi:exported hypothetical protein [Pseudomonas sp. 8AS]|uniref:GspH/FimT family pseudopilin n=1 Tax=Pseudomonas sp. 8AS TaxID=2653163 RepID=UPI0012F12127|nr:GspH/FimT family protein [Pseudomonas sp. 8AS]VXB27693.1 exported hypothetical protein [Pseudomonas sp. 8AS]